MQEFFITDNEKQIIEVAASLIVIGVSVLSRRTLRKTLVLAGVDEKLAKRVPSTISAVAFIATYSVLNTKLAFEKSNPW